MKNNNLELLKKRQDYIFEQMSGILGGLSAPVRLRLIHYLSQAPLTVETLAEKTGQSVANTSMHLRKMLSENLVQVETQGKHRIYALHPAMVQFWESCQDFIQQINPALELQTEDLFGPINWDKDLAETMELVLQKQLVLLDVRPEDEQGSEDSPFVLQISSAALEENLERLPKRKPILVICRGRFCAASATSVHLLRTHGHRAYRLDKSWNLIRPYLSA
jgi:DNA-binding transcriptional ArsR family regulator